MDGVVAAFKWVDVLQEPVDVTIDRTNLAGGTARNNAVIRHILDDDAVSADDDVVPDLNSSKNSHSRANEHVVPDNWNGFWVKLTADRAVLANDDPPPDLCSRVNHDADAEIGELGLGSNLCARRNHRVSSQEDEPLQQLRKQRYMQLVAFSRNPVDVESVHLSRIPGAPLKLLPSEGKRPICHDG
jgi:hypothetical protein